MTLNYFISVLFHHIFTHSHYTSTHSHCSHSFPPSRASVSPHNACTHATRFRERQESFTVQLFQYIQAPSHFPPIDDSFIPSVFYCFSPSSKITPFYRHGLRVTCWISLPRPLSTTISLFTYELLFPQPYLFFHFFLPFLCSRVRVLPKRSQLCHVSISLLHCSLTFACLFGSGR